MPIASMKSVFGSPDPEDDKMVAKKKTAPKKVAVKKAKAVVETVADPAPERIEPTPTRADIKITCMVETLDGSVYEKVIRIVNPTGAIPAAYVNKPDTVFDLLETGLSNKLGINHVRS